MDPPELASEPAPCYARRGRIEPPVLPPHGFPLSHTPLLLPMFSGPLPNLVGGGPPS
jgi:hypothetical protein